MNSIQTKLDNVVYGREDLFINILNDDKKNIGLLKPLVVKNIQDDVIIGKLTDWRNRHMERFLTQFIATPERTRDWMRNVLFKNKGQMLFLIDVGGTAVGHYGFKDLTTDDVLLDNAMRGEQGEDAKLLVHAGRALVNWLLTVASVKKVRAEVLTNNIPAIMMNTLIGFGNRTRHPIVAFTENSETRWELGVEGEDSPENSYCFKYFISNAEWNLSQ